ncbi:MULTISPECIES: amidase [Pseudonocardia]|uniref:Biuret hydrolase n=2 Tax=Pseudonocardia TaxID=1847 RepID=A0A1Y2N3I5_PSEAH|nr:MULTISPECIES: amidase [Pseudonocardia]OSY42024.1 Biuret hydrolase [Pseudonocardia autotrophica]TDN75207.1 aspartyl-tRNA(Asn)/glutamyl-tRNA(Gln) amidotransferase subunit A [Pseudonocardia autotrophica]BBF99152.1 amidohydrolase [Pseudonocardia autotrophica]GEC28595.1 amidohydrolase [Pseudonocardia saturnea]
MLPLPALLRALTSGELSPTDHVDDVLARLERDETGCVITLDADRARERAAELTASAARGERMGPLHGVAVGIKDLIDVAGLPTRCGSRLLADAPPAAADAAVVALLRAAGAVVVGKLHTHEFAYGPVGDTAATGPCRNPHDLSRITGGSSSGSAAAVAAGHLPLAVGTDTGASVRTPAALCGVAGLKPRRGAIPGAGVFPLAESFDTVGLLATDAASLAVARAALGGPGPANPGAVRVGIAGGGWWRPHEPVLADAVRTAADALAGLDHTVSEVDTPGVAELAATYPVITGAEAYATHRDWYATRRDEYQTATAQRLAPHAEAPAHTYVDARRARRRLASALVEHLRGRADVLVCPTTRLRATPIGADTVPTPAGDVAVRPSLLETTSPFNLTDLPVVALPVPVPGLPAGIQLVGVTVGEAELLGLAGALERALR